VSQVTLARNRSLHFLDTQQPRVLHLEPVGRAAGAIRRVLPLRRDAYQPKLASMAKDGVARMLDSVKSRISFMNAALGVIRPTAPSAARARPTHGPHQGRTGPRFLRSATALSPP
jgi:hypothetical protein